MGWGMGRSSYDILVSFNTPATSDIMSSGFSLAAPGGLLVEILRIIRSSSFGLGACNVRDATTTTTSRMESCRLKRLYRDQSDAILSRLRKQRETGKTRIWSWRFLSKGDLLAFKDIENRASFGFVQSVEEAHKPASSSMHCPR